MQSYSNEALSISVTSVVELELAELLKFINSEKATTFCEISTVDLTVATGQI